MIDFAINIQYIDMIIMRSPSTRHLLPVGENFFVFVDHAIIYTTVAIYFPSTAEYYLHLRSVTTRYNLV